MLQTIGQTLVAPVRLALSVGGIAVGVPWGPVLAVVIVQLVGAGFWRVYQRPDLMEGWIVVVERWIELFKRRKG